MPAQAKADVVEVKKGEVKEGAKKPSSPDSVVLTETQLRVLDDVQRQILRHSAEPKAIIQQAEQAQISRKIFDEAVLGVIRGLILDRDFVYDYRSFEREASEIGKGFNISEEKIRESVIEAACERIPKMFPKDDFSRNYRTIEQFIARLKTFIGQEGVINIGERLFDDFLEKGKNEQLRQILKFIELPKLKEEKAILVLKKIREKIKGRGSWGDLDSSFLMKYFKDDEKYSSTEASNQAEETIEECLKEGCGDLALSISKHFNIPSRILPDIVVAIAKDDLTDKNLVKLKEELGINDNDFYSVLYRTEAARLSLGDEEARKREAYEKSSRYYDYDKYTKWAKYKPHLIEQIPQEFFESPQFTEATIKALKDILSAKHLIAFKTLMKKVNIPDQAKKDPDLQKAAEECFMWLTGEEANRSELHLYLDDYLILLADNLGLSNNFLNRKDTKDGIDSIARGRYDFWDLVRFNERFGVSKQTLAFGAHLLEDEFFTHRNEDFKIEEIVRIIDAVKSWGIKDWEKSFARVKKPNLEKLLKTGSPENIRKILEAFYPANETFQEEFNSIFSKLIIDDARGRSFKNVDNLISELHISNDRLDTLVNSALVSLIYNSMGSDEPINKVVEKFAVSNDRLVKCAGKALLERAKGNEFYGLKSFLEKFNLSDEFKKSEEFNVILKKSFRTYFAHSADDEIFSIKKLLKIEDDVFYPLLEESIIEELTKRFEDTEGTHDRLSPLIDLLEKNKLAEDSIKKILSYVLRQRSGYKNHYPSIEAIFELNGLENKREEILKTSAEEILKDGKFFKFAEIVYRTGISFEAKEEKEIKVLAKKALIKTFESYVNPRNLESWIDYLKFWDIMQSDELQEIYLKKFSEEFARGKWGALDSSIGLASYKTLASDNIQIAAKKAIHDHLLDSYYLYGKVLFNDFNNEVKKKFNLLSDEEKKLYGQPKLLNGNEFTEDAKKGIINQISVGNSDFKLDEVCSAFNINDQFLNSKDFLSAGKKGVEFLIEHRDFDAILEFVKNLKIPQKSYQQQKYWKTIFERFIKGQLAYYPEGAQKASDFFGIPQSFIEEEVNNVFEDTVENGDFSMAINFYKSFKDVIKNKQFQIAYDAFGDFLDEETFQTIQKILAGELTLDIKSLGIKSAGEAGINELRQYIQKFTTNFVGKELLPGDIQMPVLENIVKTAVRFSSSSWGNHGDDQFKKAVKAYEVLMNSGKIDPLKPEYLSSEEIRVSSLDRKAQNDFKYSEQFVAKYETIRNSLLGAYDLLDEKKALSAIAAIVQRKIEEEAKAQQEKATQLENPKAKENIQRKIGELLSVDPRSIRNFQENFRILSEYKGFQEELRQLVFYMALKRNPAHKEQLRFSLKKNPELTDVSSILDFVDHIVNQETMANYFTDINSVRAFKGIINLRSFEEELVRAQDQAKVGTIPLKFFSTRGLLMEFSGHIADACWASRYDSIAATFPNMTSVIIVQNPDNKNIRLAGAAMLIEGEDREGTPLLIIRGLNPIENLINHVSVDEFFSEFTKYVGGLAAKMGRKVAIAVDDHSGGATTNRPVLFNYISNNFKGKKRISLKKSYQFNGYDIGHMCCMLED